MQNFWMGLAENWKGWNAKKPPCEGGKWHTAPVPCRRPCGTGADVKHEGGINGGPTAFFCNSTLPSHLADGHFYFTTLPFFVKCHPCRAVFLFQSNAARHFSGV